MPRKEQGLRHPNMWTDEGSEGTRLKLPADSRKKLLDARSDHLRLTPLPSPDPARVRASVVARTPELAEEGYFQDYAFAAGYMGYYEANGCILMGQFGDPEADGHAFSLLRSRYPGRRIVQLTTDGLANGGGTIRYATQQQIATRDLDRPAKH